MRFYFRMTSITWLWCSLVWLTISHTHWRSDWKRLTDMRVTCQTLSWRQRAAHCHHCFSLVTLIAPFLLLCDGRLYFFFFYFPLCICGCLRISFLFFGYFLTWTFCRYFRCLNSSIFHRVCSVRVPHRINNSFPVKCREIYVLRYGRCQTIEAHSGYTCRWVESSSLSEHLNKFSNLRWIKPLYVPFSNVRYRFLQRG